jgi:hypothetical protein
MSALLKKQITFGPIIFVGHKQITSSQLRTLANESSDEIKKKSCRAERDEINLIDRDERQVCA